MKKMISLFMAMLLLCTIWALPAYAAEEGKSSSYYPISVDEYVGGDFDEPRIQKVYQLSLDDDPAKIPTEDFVRNGRLYYLLDMTRQDKIGVDTKNHVQTVTLVTTHNTLLMDSDLSVGAFYVIQKQENGVRHIDCITETVSRVHPNHNVQNRYLRGDYGGIPAHMNVSLHDLLQILDHGSPESNGLPKILDGGTNL